MKKYLIFTLILFLLGCSDNSDNRVLHMGIKSSLENIKLFLNTNIYFGHQSVGNNIINGIKEILIENEINDFKPFELNAISTLPKNYFVHSPIGKNGNPISKIEDFKKDITILKNKNLKIAMMKFCYVDFNEKTNIDKIFDYYIKAIDSIKTKNPNLIILHLTVPLKSERSFLGKIKAYLTGKSDKTFNDNYVRNQYNDLIRSKYSSEYIFDIAKIESTYPDGKREIKTLDNKSCYYLSKIYTSDGGHLNGFGQKVVANELINKIAKINLRMKESS